MEISDMALLDGLLGGIGGGSASTSADIGAVIETNPHVDVGASDVNVLGLASIGDLGVSVGVPALIGADASVAHDSSGGLLGGLL
jgi:hypothetical protein